MIKEKVVRITKPEKKVFLIVIDGMGERIYKDEPTALEQASTPNMDELARMGRCGLHHFPFFISPGSAIAHWILLGQSLDNFPGRGVLEAVGYEARTGESILKIGDLVFRANLATVDKDLIILDRRAGDTEYGFDVLEEEINKIGEKYGIIYRRTIGHRGVLISRIEKTLVDDVDTYKVGEKPNLDISPKVREFLLEVFSKLNNHPVNLEREKRGEKKANFLLLRGAGIYHGKSFFFTNHGISALGISDKDLYLGVAAYLGMDTLFIEDDKKIKEALNRFDKYDFFFVHFKLSDTFGERGLKEEKVKYLEKIDGFLGELIGKEIVVCVTADHSTPYRLKRHTSDPVPFLIYNPTMEADSVNKFTEKECRKGWYGITTTEELFYLIMNEAGALYPCREIGEKK